MMWEHLHRTRKGVDIWRQRIAGRVSFEYDITMADGSGGTREPHGVHTHTSMRAAREAASRAGNMAAHLNRPH